MVNNDTAALGCSGAGDGFIREDRGRRVIGPDFAGWRSSEERRGAGLTLHELGRFHNILSETTKCPQLRTTGEEPVERVGPRDVILQLYSGVKYKAAGVRAETDRMMKSLPLRDHFKSRRCIFLFSMLRLLL